MARDAAYLLRPDTYVALAEPSGSADAIERYFAMGGIRPTADDALREHGTISTAAVARQPSVD